MKLPAALIALFILHPSSFILSAEPPGVPILRIEAGMHTATIRRIATDAADAPLVGRALWLYRVGAKK